MSTHPHSWKNAEEGYLIVFRYVYNDLRRNLVSPRKAADLAEEATQNAFLAFSERFGWCELERHFESEAKIVAYLTKTALNKIKEEFRRKRAVMFSELGGEPPSAADSCRDSDLELLMEGFAHVLTAEERRLLELKYEKGWTDEAIAETMIPPDHRTKPARGQALRQRRLEAEMKLRRFLLKNGVDPFAFRTEYGYIGG